MALIIESGEGLPNAESYATAAELVSYAEKHGRVIPSTTPEQEALLRNSAEAMKEMNWKGQRTNGAQWLDFPRAGVEVDGEIKPSNLIPREIQYGQMALATEMYADIIDPPSQRTGPVIRERVEGAVDVQYGAIPNNSGYLLPAAPGRPSRTQFANYLVKRGLSGVRA